MNKKNISMSNLSKIMGKNLITTHVRGNFLIFTAINFGVKFGRMNNYMATKKEVTSLITLSLDSQEQKSCLDYLSP